MRPLAAPPARAELVVVGSGIVGAASAFFASRAGLQVVVLERRPVACTLTTAVAAGGVRMQLENPLEFRLVRRSVELIERFAEETGQSHFEPRLRRRGYLWLTTSEDTARRQHALVEEQRGFGVDGVELLDGDEVRRRFPFVGPDVVQARFRAHDAFVDPRRIALGLLRGSGASLVTDCDVRGFDVAGGRLRALETSRGTIACERAVIAAGPLSGELAARAGVRLPVELVRRHRLTLPELPEVPADAPMTIDEDTTAHWRPALAGAFCFYPDPREPPTPPAEDVLADGRFPFRLLDPRSPTALARVCPFWERVWEESGASYTLQAGLYTMTPDQLPLIGETEIAGLYVNTGYSGHGVMAGPGGSALLGELLSGALREDENPFRLERAFAAPTQAF